jgi:hypothetical protein
VTDSTSAGNVEHLYLEFLNIIAQCFFLWQYAALRNNGTFIYGGILDEYYKFISWGKIGLTCCLAAVIVFRADNLTVLGLPVKHVIAAQFCYREKGISLPGKGSFQDLKDAMVVTHPKDLSYFLQPFLISTPCIAYVLGPHFTYKVKSKFIVISTILFYHLGRHS